MARSRILLELALSSTLVLACSDRPALTDPTGASPALRTARGSVAAGAAVFHGPTDYATILVDERRNLTVVAGVPLEQLAQVCAEGTGLFTFDPGTVVIVQRPDSSLHLLRKSRHLSIVVFEGLFPGDFCTGFLSTPPLVTGTVRAMFRDNDFFLSLNRADSFHESLRGQGIYTNTGEPVRIWVRMKGLIGRDFSIRKLTTDIVLK
jgi:hypothetical protein